MKKKVKKTKKPKKSLQIEKRNKTLYAYVTPANLEWVRAAAVKTDVSVSHVVNELIVFTRKMFGDRAVRLASNSKRA